MSRFAKIFLIVVTPALALLLALLGVATIHSNPVGWFLILVGVGYNVGLIIVFLIRKKRFLDSLLNGIPTEEERGDCSLWLITLAMTAAFFLPPVEYICLPTSLPRNALMAFSGLVLVSLGIVLFIWARRVLGINYSGHVSVKTGQTLVESGPYRLIRHPAYAGYLLMALGISLGYSSLAGMASILVMLLVLIYRMRLEERMLTKYFGEAYHQYICKTKRLIPWIW